MTPLLVAYQDGFTDANNQPVPWKMVTASTSVDFTVGDAYSVAVVCMVKGRILTWQASRTVEDDTSDTVKEVTLNTPCNAAPTLRTVTGKTVQDANVHLGDADAGATHDATFTLQVVDGTYDLIATTKNADPSTNTTLIQRNVMISGDTTLNGGNGIDVSTGMTQVPLGIALSSPPDPTKSTETVSATVDVTTKNNSGSATVSAADYDLKNKTIKIFALPNAALNSGDTQTATFTGTDNPLDANKKPIKTITFSRAITMPFSIGDMTATGMNAFSLPAAIKIPDWGFDKNRLSVALPALPALDDITITTSGKTTDGTGADYEIDITEGYFNTTALARPVFDTDLPGFQATWKIDFTQQYQRQITSERDVFNKGVFVDHETSTFSETVNAP